MCDIFWNFVLEMYSFVYMGSQILGREQPNFVKVDFRLEGIQKECSYGSWNPSSLKKNLKTK